MFRPRAFVVCGTLTRTRAKIGQNVATSANRIQKVLEDANVKLGSVATDVLGVSGREMLKALIKGQRDPKQLAQLARGRLRKKLSELQLALEGHFTEHHGFQIQALLELVEHPGQLSIVVEDDGVGIDEREGPKGRGLDTIRSKIAYLNGRIEISRKKEKGTLIVIEIPV